jgi:hypothetical protein
MFFDWTCHYLNVDVSLFALNFHQKEMWSPDWPFGLTLPLHWPNIQLKMAEILSRLPQAARQLLRIQASVSLRHPWRRVCMADEMASMFDTTMQNYSRIGDAISDIQSQKESTLHPAGRTCKALSGVEVVLDNWIKAAEQMKKMQRWRLPHFQKPMRCYPSLAHELLPHLL